MARYEDVELNAPREWAALIPICVFAIGFRLLGLGSLSFARDDQTTTLAALVLIEVSKPMRSWLAADLEAAAAAPTS